MSDPSTAAVPPGMVNQVDELLREVTFAALTGWDRLPPAHMRRLVRMAADAGRWDVLMRSGGLLADADWTALCTALWSVGDVGRVWAHLLTGADLPEPGTTPAAQAERLRVAASGLPGLDPAIRSTVEAWAGPPTRPGLTVRWSTVPDTVHVALPGYTRWLKSVAAVPTADGRTLVVSGGNDRTVRLWDPITGQAVGEPLTGHTDEVSAVTAVPLPDGRVLLASGDRDHVIRLWDATTGQPVGEPLTTDGSPVDLGVVTTPDGTVLLVADCVVNTDTGHGWWSQFWDVATGRPYGYPLPGANTRRAAVPLPDGRTLVAVFQDECVRLWDPVDGRIVAEVPHVQNTWATSIFPVRLTDGRVLLVSNGAENMVHLTDAVTGQPAGPPLRARPVLGISRVAPVPMPDGRTLIAGAAQDDKLHLWDIDTRHLVGEPRSAGAVEVAAAVAMPDGLTLIATGSHHGLVRLWDPTTGQPVGTPLTGHTGAVCSLVTSRVSAGRTLLAAAARDTSHQDDRHDALRVWDAVTGEPVGPPLVGWQHGVKLLRTVTLPDGRVLLVAGGRDFTVRLWDLVTRQPVGTFVVDRIDDDNFYVDDLVVLPSPGGRVVLAISSHGDIVDLWDVGAGERIGDQFSTGHGVMWMMTAVPLPDGDSLLTTCGSDATVRLWDPATAQPVHAPLRGHHVDVWTITPVPLADGRVLLATGDEDGQVRLWDPVNGRPVGRPLTGHTGTVLSATPLARPDGRVLLATGGGDGSVRLWDPLTQRELARAVLPGAVRSVIALDDDRLLVAHSEEVAVLDLVGL